MSERMEALQAALAEDRVPDTWTAKPRKMTNLKMWCNVTTSLCTDYIYIYIYICVCVHIYIYIYIYVYI